MPSKSTSILTISDSYRHPELNTGFRLSQQTWLELATTPFHKLTADSALRMLVTSAQIAQQSPVNIVYLYAIVFDEERVLMQRTPVDGTAVEMGQAELWTIPHHGQPLFPDDNDGKNSIKDAVARFLRDDEGVACVPDSAYLVRAILPVQRGPIAAAVVRLEIDKQGLQDHQTLNAGEWLDRKQVEGMKEAEMHPDGLKQLILDAFEQKQFEGEVLAE